MADVNLQELVSKCAPFVYYFPGNSYVGAEQNLPSSVDYYVAGVRYVRASGQTFEPGWTWSDVAPMSSGDFLEIVDPSVQGGNLDSATLYVHVLPVTGDAALIDIQYWFFFPYNGDETAFASLSSGGDPLVALPIPFSRHEGDWEHVVVRTDLNGSIAAVYYAQHSWGSWLNEAAGDNPDGYTTHDGHPIVYCAVGSHASYPMPGGPFPIAEVTPGGTRIGLEDFTGAGASVDYSQAGRTVIVKNDFSSIDFPVTPPPWLAFPGRWGQTQ